MVNPDYLSIENIEQRIRGIDIEDEAANRRLVFDTRAALLDKRERTYTTNLTVASVALWGVHGSDNLKEVLSSDFANTAKGYGKTKLATDRLEDVAGQIIVARKPVPQRIRPDETEPSKTVDITRIGKLANAKLAGGEDRTASWIFGFQGVPERYQDESFRRLFINSSTKTSDKFKGTLFVAIEPVEPGDGNRLDLWDGSGIYEAPNGRPIHTREMDKFSVGVTQFVHMADEVATSAGVVDRYNDLLIKTAATEPSTIEF